MHIPIKDEYVRDFSFEPEIILRRKDSLDIQREKYHRKRLMTNRKRLKQAALQALAKHSLPRANHEQKPIPALGGSADVSESEASVVPSVSIGEPATPISVSSFDDARPTSALDDLDPADKEEIRRSVVDIEIEEFYYVSAGARKVAGGQSSLLHSVFPTLGRSSRCLFRVLFVSKCITVVYLPK